MMARESKIQSLMQAINIAEYAILNVTKIDKYLGEQIIALDAVIHKRVHLAFV
jgi:selenocysteine-specific translation elongation factor